MAAVSRDRVREALLPVVTGAGFDLEDVTVGAAGRRQIVRVVVDRDGGIDLDAVAEASRLISGVLDDSEVVGSASYTLEVTSPGVDRPLTEPRHWRRAAGRLVAAAGATGRIVGADDDGVTIDVDGAKKHFGYGELGTGRIQVEFARTAKADAGDSS
jgi:ribosome maturation factor RimP